MTRRSGFADRQDLHIPGDMAFTDIMFHMRELCVNLKWIDKKRKFEFVSEREFPISTEMFRMNFGLGITDFCNFRNAIQINNQLIERMSEKSISRSIFSPSYHDNLVKELAMMTMNKPRISAILTLVRNKEYSKALRTAANDEQDGLIIVTLLLKYKDSLKINIDEQAGDKNRAASHWAIIKQKWDILDLLLANGASPSLKDIDGLCAEMTIRPAYD
jgi:hypothetical protein